MGIILGHDYRHQSKTEKETLSTLLLETSEVLMIFQEVFLSIYTQLNFTWKTSILARGQSVTKLLLTLITYTHIY